MICALAFVSILFQFKFVVLSKQGLAFDPDEDKEEVLLKQIEEGVKNWFAFHKYDDEKEEEEQRAPFTFSVSNMDEDAS